MTDNKLSELKAAAMAATPGPWISGDDSWSDGDDSWSDGDHVNISTEKRYDSGIINIAQVDGGGSESGFDEPFSTEQQANARYITAANPAVILDLLAELEAKDKRIAELEDQSERLKKELHNEGAVNAHAYERIRELEERLATPVRLPTKYSLKMAGDKSTRAMFSGHNSAINDSADAIRVAGFTVEGDE